MKENELNWYIINKHYVEYLKKFDNKVQKIDYGDNIKPYIGIILELKEFKYYVPISSVKEKHKNMSENIDFVKISDEERLISVINLNNMIPISNNNVELLHYFDITKHFNFKNEDEKFKYIALLRKELSIINSKKDNILRRAKRLYAIKRKFPNTNISKRCCNFKLLEQKCLEYQSQI